MRSVLSFVVALGVGIALAPDAGAQAAWTVDTVPMMHIAGTGPTGDALFERAIGAARLSNGTIVIAEPTGGSLRYFDATGRPTRTVGRRGKGPGEFMLISWLGRCAADTVSSGTLGSAA